MKSSISRVACAAVAALSVSTLMAGPAQALEPGARTPVPRVTVALAAPADVRLDSQVGAGLTTATFTGASTQSRLSLTLADGTVLESSRGRCTPRKAAARPTQCTVALIHEFTAPGDYTIIARQVTGTGAGAKSGTQQAHVVVHDNPRRWTPVAGQVYNGGWVPYSRGATFYPCQTVNWYFDRTGEPADRNTMIDDIRGATALLAPLTGLTFTEVSSADAADVKFSWGDLAALGHPTAAGVGGPTGVGKGAVTFSPTDNWTTNQWAGLPVRRIQWDRPDLGPGWYSWMENAGRQALVIHELMHAMGFDHTTDFTSIMYPQGITNGQGKFSSGDIEGLATMYLNNPCPYVPAAA